METVHGGDLDAAVRLYGLKREEIKDFSGNINPFGMPESAKKAIIDNIEKASTYPDKNYLELRMAIAKYVGADTKSVIVGNGGTELISLFIRATGAKKALIVAPVYSEYEREIRINGGSCVYYALREERSFSADISDLCAHINGDIDLLAICNPNNPTGTAISSDDMETVVRACSERNIRVLIDETYCEFADVLKYSSVSIAEKYDGVIVIRGVSKFFASPGLRLGYAVCGEKMLAEMDKIRDPWTVNILAAIAAEAFFYDKDYIEATKLFFTEERERVKNRLSQIKSIRVYETVTNFQLFKLLTGEISSADIFEKLIAKGMMIRDAKSFMFLDSSFLRFCFLKREDNDCLLNELKKILG